MSIEDRSWDSACARLSGHALDLAVAARALARVATEALAQLPARPTDEDTEALVQAAAQAMSGAGLLTGLSPAQRRIGAEVADELAALIADLAH